MPVSFDPDRDIAIDRARKQFRWSGGGWKVNAELPAAAGFAVASQFVTRNDVADAILCSDDIDAVVRGAETRVKAGFTHLALCQIGGDSQPAFAHWAANELLPALRELSLP